MFLKILEKTLKSIGFRLSAWYSGFFISSSILILIATYFFLSSSMKFADQQAIISEINRLASQYESQGMASLQREEVENVQYRKRNPFFSGLDQNTGTPVPATLMDNHQKKARLWNDVFCWDTALMSPALSKLYCRA